MCEKCVQNKARMENEIEQLVNREGELWDRILDMDALKELDDEEQRERVAETVRLSAIAARCAFAASYIIDGEFHGMNPALILGIWSGEALEIEMQRSMAQELFNHLGLGNN